MPLPALEEILKKDEPFQAHISMVGVNALSGMSPNFVFDFKVQSEPFFLNGLNYSIRTSLRGSFNLFNPTTSHMEKFGITQEQVDAENKATLNGIFDSESESFAFNSAELKDFFEGLHFIHFARNDHSSLMIKAKDIQIPTELQEQATKQLVSYLKSIAPLFYQGQLKTQAQFLANF